MLRSRSPKPSMVVGLQDSRSELAGSGPSAIVRRPMRRRGGKPTAVSLPSSSPSAALPLSCQFPSVGRDELGGTKSCRRVTGGMRTIERGMGGALRVAAAAAGAKFGVSEGSARRSSGSCRRGPSMVRRKYERAELSSSPNDSPDSPRRE